VPFDPRWIMCEGEVSGQVGVEMLSGIVVSARTVAVTIADAFLVQDGSNR